MMTPYKPHALSQEDVEVLQKLIFSKKKFSFSQNDPSQHLQFIAPSESSLGKAPFLFALEVEQQKVELFLEPSAESAFLGRLSELGGIEAVPEEFRTGLTAFCARHIIDAFQTLLAIPISLWVEKKAVSPENLPVKELHFQIFKEEGILEASGKMTVPLPLLRRLLSLASTLPETQEFPLKKLPLLGEILIGAFTLPLTQWTHLTPGSLLFLQGSSTLTTGLGAFLLKGNKKKEFALAPQELEALVVPLEKMLLFPFTPQESETTSPLQEEGSQKESASPSTAITVEVSAGSAALTLEEVLNLSTTVPLNRSLKVVRPLKLLAQGEVIASGELVNIHGQYAFFITQLTPLS